MPIAHTRILLTAVSAVAVFVVTACGSTAGVTTAKDQLSSSSSVSSTGSSSDEGSETKGTPASEVSVSSDTTFKSAASSESETNESSNGAPEKGAVGDSITLKGSDSTLKATLVNVTDPAKPANEFSKPDDGDHYVAVTFRLANVDDSAYVDSPSNGAVLVDSKGQHYDASITGDVQAGPGFGGSLKVSPHTFAMGNVVFEVPDSTDVAKIQFGMDSGFGQTGQWAVDESNLPASAEPMKLTDMNGFDPSSLAGLNDSITLSGADDGSKVKITPVDLADPAKPANEFSKPDDGDHYVAVQFKLENVGTALYSDSPSNGAALVDMEGHHFAADITGDTKAGKGFSGSVKITPSDKALGYLVFEVPDSSKPVLVQFGMDSGFGGTGEWWIGE